MYITFRDILYFIVDRIPYILTIQFIANRFGELSLWFFIYANIFTVIFSNILDVIFVFADDIIISRETHMRNSGGKMYKKTWKGRGCESVQLFKLCGNIPSEVKFNVVVILSIYCYIYLFVNFFINSNIILRGNKESKIQLLLLLLCLLIY